MTGRSLIKRPEHSLTVQVEPEIPEERMPSLRNLVLAGVDDLLCGDGAPGLEIPRHQRLVEPVVGGGVGSQVPALVAIMTALFQLQFAGNARANAVLTRFQSFAPQISELKIEFERPDDRN